MYGTYIMLMYYTIGNNFFAGNHIYLLYFYITVNIFITNII